jgi:hypothetical protein
MIAVAVMASSAVMFSCDDDDDDDSSTKRNYAISGNASGSQVVPAVTGTGAGTISGTYNPNTRVLTYTNTWTGLTGAPTGGGFYYGASGVNGVAVGTPWTFAADATGTGTSSGTITLTEAQADQLLDGDWYYGYNTATNTSGEVRGQITATQQVD